VQHHALFEIGIQIHRTHLTHRIKGNASAHNAPTWDTNHTSAIVCRRPPLGPAPAVAV
jgi:hypothetical protein